MSPFLPFRANLSYHIMYAQQERELDAHQQVGPLLSAFSACKRLGVEVPARGRAGFAGTTALAEHASGLRKQALGSQCACCVHRSTDCSCHL